MPAHQYNLLQVEILAQLPRVNEEGEGSYLTAHGLKARADANPHLHPAVAGATLTQLRAHLGILARTGAVVRIRRSTTGRKPKCISYAVQPVKRP